MNIDNAKLAKLPAGKKNIANNNAKLSQAKAGEKNNNINDYATLSQS